VACDVDDDKEQQQSPGKRFEGTHNTWAVAAKLVNSRAQKSTTTIEFG